MSNPSRDEAKKVLLRCLDQKRRPLLIGEAALVLGPFWSLEKTEALLSEMVKEGDLRPIREDEVRLFDTRDAYVRCK